MSIFPHGRPPETRWSDYYRRMATCMWCTPVDRLAALDWLAQNRVPLEDDGTEDMMDVLARQVTGVL